MLPANDFAACARAQRLIRHLHQLGERPLGEFLNELAVEHGIGVEIIRKLHQYQRLDRDIVRAFGGDRFAPSPLRAVGDDR